ncbi:transporter substrate-binding domain-containing protein [Ammoniphilus sp. CFH 90114]|uniref:transporter substrate-binding domain-containing protein n=1 Tax=Ammoniphilus sp. CFH 90114 TaxID=2493665 RepID=UPI00100F0825|nr:transporter substrate-binding domain-containing protein [Ammoniphilus sp. CFH 90114]RXT07785.1 transporter substrate-binding domain-containing protein [Ammoniphilus sp. CFH 90114]
MKKWILAGLASVLMFTAGCSQSTSTGPSEASTLEKIQDKKKIVIGTAPGYMPFEMKDKQGNFIGYDIDLGNAIGESMKVPVEFKQFEFSGLIPALQTGEIDMIIAGMTIRGDRALAVSFANPYYATGQVLMVPTKDNSTKTWEDLDQPGKKIAVSLGTTGALLAKQLFKQATVVDFDDFPTAGMAMIQGQADGIVYDEPGVRIFTAMNKDSVKGIYELISTENLGIAVRHNDLATVQWLNSFLEAYRNSPTELASREKWFNTKDWMDNVEGK